LLPCCSILGLAWQRSGLVLLLHLVLSRLLHLILLLGNLLLLPRRLLGLCLLLLLLLRLLQLSKQLSLDIRGHASWGIQTLREELLKIGGIETPRRTVLLVLTSKCHKLSLVVGSETLQLFALLQGEGGLVAL
jgi:hypothetical protein